MTSQAKSTILFILPLLGVLFALPSQAQVCIKFEPPDFVIGDIYGAPVGQVSGDLAFTFSLIDGYVYNFNLWGSGTAFNRAFITNPPVVFSSGQSLRLNNINLLFDFTHLGFTVRKVTFAYLDLGGYENLAINGGGVYIGELSAAPPVMTGTNVSVTSMPVPPPIIGKKGNVSVTGANVKSVMVGGQELWIDSVCAQ
jgi:hypothetical protein